MVLIFAGTNFRESKINAFCGYLFSRINTDFLQISLFYADFDAISEKPTFREYLISRNQQKFAKFVKISTRLVIRTWSTDWVSNNGEVEYIFLVTKFQISGKFAQI